MTKNPLIFANRNKTSTFLVFFAILSTSSVLEEGVDKCIYSPAPTSPFPHFHRNHHNITPKKKQMILKSVFLLAVLAVANCAKLPSAFKRCSKSAAGFDECVRAEIEHAIRYLKNGAPELGLNTFDPLSIDELIIGQGSGPVNVQQNFHNVKLHGLTGSLVLEEHVLLDRNTLLSKSITPMLRLEADYDMKGRVLLLPIVGEGRCNVTLWNTKINHTLSGERYEKKGKTFMKFVNYTVTLRPDKVEYHFANLFNGDERLGTEVNRVLNDNWDAVFTDVRAGYEKSFGLIFQDLANRVFTRVPLKDIFLD